MKFVVQKMPSRSIDNILEQVPDVIISEHPEVTPNEAFIKSLEHSGHEDHIHLEDDVLLCSQFRNKVVGAVNKFPGKMISFFTLRKIVMLMPNMPGGNFCMAQCIYIPGWMSKQLCEYYPLWQEQNPNDRDGMDLFVADFLHSKRKSYVLWFPCLVQHKVGKSVIDPKRSSKRQTENFL